MSNLSPDLCATYVEILVVLILAFVIDNRLGEYAASKARKLLGWMILTCVILDGMALLALVVWGLRNGFPGDFNAVFTTVISLSVGVLIGSFAGHLNVMNKDELHSTRED